MSESVDSDVVEIVTASLSDWLLQSQWKPDVLLKGVAAGSGRISIADIETAVQLASDHRLLLSRAFEIVRASRKAAPPLRGDIQQFGQRVVGAVASGLSAWLQDNHLSSREELQRLTEWARPSLASKDAARRKEAEQILGIGLTLLQFQRPVPPLVLLDLIADAFSLAKAEGESDKRPERAVAALIAKSNPRQIALLSKVSRLQDALVHAAQDQARQDARLLTAARKEVEALESRLASEALRSATLAKTVTHLEAKCEEFQRQLNGAKEIFAHDIEDLKARYRRILGETLKQLASDATDALELEPPKPDFSKKYLAQLLRTVDGEMTWLNARSE